MLLLKKGMAANIVKNDGALALYNGISASVLRQATYSTTRFAVYETGKKNIMNSSKDKNSDLPFIKKVALAGGSGLIGSLIGNFHIFIYLLFLDYFNIVNGNMV